MYNDGSFTLPDPREDMEEIDYTEFDYKDIYKNCPTGRPIGFLVKNSEGDLIIVDGENIPFPDVLVESVKYYGYDQWQYRHIVEQYNKYMLDRLASAYHNSQEPKDRYKAGYVYAVRAGDKIKIGRTTNLNNRLRQYKKGYHNYSLLCSVEASNPVKLEAEFLEKFGGKAGSNEWLDWSEVLEARVKELFSA